MDVKYGCFIFDLYLLSLLNLTRNKYVNIDGSIYIYYYFLLG